MINGLLKFKEYFADYKDQYVLIGGAACDIIMEEFETRFRATKDLDLVLIVEALTPEFGKTFWSFIQAGQYENMVRNDGLRQFYRFDKPKTEDFPWMIELFARTDIGIGGKQEIVSVHIDDAVSSLSAILLNDDYYQMLKSGKTIISDLVILSPLYLIPFKAKAWLDLTERKEQGQSIDSTDIKKHKNDITRLAAILTGNEVLDLPISVKRDMNSFIKLYEQHPPTLQDLSIKGVSVFDLIELLKRIYLK